MCVFCCGSNPDFIYAKPVWCHCFGFYVAMHRLRTAGRELSGKRVSVRGFLGHMAVGVSIGG